MVEKRIEDETLGQVTGGSPDQVQSGQANPREERQLPDPPKADTGR